MGLKVKQPDDLCSCYGALCKLSDATSDHLLRIMPVKTCFDFLKMCSIIAYRMQSRGRESIFAIFFLKNLQF